MAPTHKQSMLHRAGTSLRQSLVINVLLSIVDAVLKWLFEKTHGVTSKFLSRHPLPPGLSVSDARCNRIRLRFQPKPSSIFNKDVYEVQHVLAGSEGDAEWRSDPDTDQPGRVIAPLQHSTAYSFRVRTKNSRGVSNWSSTVTASTLLRPVDGGAATSGYTWTQSGIEVTASWALPAGVRARDINVELHPQHLRITYTLDGAETTVVDGALSHRVRSLTPGGTSYWELERDGGACVMTVTLEKEKAAQNIKMDFWRSVFEGHPEIDTHYITSDPHVKPMQPVGGSSPFSMQTVDAEGLARLRSRKAGGMDLPASMQDMYAQARQ